jgi:hypothetical protein
MTNSELTNSISIQEKIDSNNKIIVGAKDVVDLTDNEQSEESTGSEINGVKLVESEKEKNKEVKEALENIRKKMDGVKSGVNDVLNDNLEDGDLNSKKQSLEGFKESITSFLDELNSLKYSDKEDKKIGKNLKNVIRLSIKRIKSREKKIDKKIKKLEKESENNEEKKNLNFKERFKQLKQLLKFKGSWWDLYGLKHPKHKETSYLNEELFVDLKVNDGESYSDLEKKIIEKHGNVHSYVKKELKKLRQEYLNYNSLEDDSESDKENQDSELKDSEETKLKNEGDKKNDKEKREISELEKFLENNKDSSFEEMEDELREIMMKEIDENKEVARSGEFSINAIVSSNAEKRKKIVNLFNELKNQVDEEKGDNENKFDWQEFKFNDAKEAKDFLDNIINSKFEMTNELEEKMTQAIDILWNKAEEDDPNIKGDDFFSKKFQNKDQKKGASKLIFDLVLEKAHSRDEGVDENKSSSDDSEERVEIIPNVEVGKDKFKDESSKEEIDFSKSERFTKFVELVNNKKEDEENFDQFLYQISQQIKNSMSLINKNFSESEVFGKGEYSLGEWGESFESDDADISEINEDFIKNLDENGLKTVINFLIKVLLAEEIQHESNLDNKKEFYKNMIAFCLAFNKSMEEKQI